MGCSIRGRLTPVAAVQGSLTPTATVRGSIAVATIQRDPDVLSVNGKIGHVQLDAEDVGAASQEDFSAHINDNVVHVTENERLAWNQAVAASVNGSECLVFIKAIDLV